MFYSRSAAIGWFLAAGSVSSSSELLDEHAKLKPSIKHRQTDCDGLDVVVTSQDEIDDSPIGASKQCSDTAKQITVEGTDETCLDLTTASLSSLEVVSVGSLEYTESFPRCVNASAVYYLDTFTLNLTGSAVANIYLSRMGGTAQSNAVTISDFRINLDSWWNSNGIFFAFTESDGATSVGNLSILGTLQSEEDYYHGIYVNITSATDIDVESCIISPFLESARSIKMVGDKPCLYSLNMLTTVNTMVLENLLGYLEGNLEVEAIVLPSLTKVTNSLTIGPSSVQSLSAESLASVSQTLTIHGQQNMSDISFPSLQSLDSLIVYDNGQTMLPGDFRKLTNVYYIYLNGYIDDTVAGALFLSGDLTVNDNITVLPWNENFDCSWITKQYNDGKFANAICNGTNPINTLSQQADSNGTASSSSSSTETSAKSTTTTTTTISVAVVVPIVSLALLSGAAWCFFRRFKRRRQSMVAPSQDTSHRTSELPASSVMSWQTHKRGASDGANTVTSSELGGRPVSELQGEGWRPWSPQMNGERAELPYTPHIPEERKYNSYVGEGDGLDQNVRS